jgi:RHS repeat-associated protein
MTKVSTTTNYDHDKANQLTSIDGVSLAYDANGNMTSDGTSPVNYFYVLNLHGDVLGLRDSNGNMVVDYFYDSFGHIKTSSGTASTGDGKLLRTENPFRYASYFYDEETDIYYLNARYYDPSVGRFITRDVIPHVNLYVYGENNPVNFVDPSGYFSMHFGPMIDGQWLTVEAIQSPKVKNNDEIKTGSKTKDWHYNRNKKNNPPVTEQGAKKLNWTKLPGSQSIFHQIGEENKSNTKYVSPDGKMEGVYRNGVLTSDPKNIATYNYLSPSNPGHLIVDVVPYILWGNTPNDPTDVLFRVKLSALGGISQIVITTPMLMLD